MALSIDWKKLADPTFKSSIKYLIPAAAFLDIIDANKMENKVFYSNMFFLNKYIVTKLPIINPSLSTVAVTSRALYRTESAGDKSSEPTIKHPKLLPMSNSF